MSDARARAKPDIFQRMMKPQPTSFTFEMLDHGLIFLAVQSIEEGYEPGNLRGFLLL